MNDIKTDQLVKRLGQLKQDIKKPSYLEENIDEWIKQIKQFKMPSSGKGIDFLVKTVLDPIESEIRNGDPNNFLVPLHSMQGILSRNMAMSKDAKNSAMSLYWLGLIENSFHEDFMFSLGDMYLKRCINDFSKSKFAEKCFEAIKESYTLGFTGSSGTNLPNDIKVELNELKAKIGK